MIVRETPYNVQPSENPSTVHFTRELNTPAGETNEKLSSRKFLTLNQCAYPDDESTDTIDIHEHCIESTEYFNKKHKLKSLNAGVMYHLGRTQKNLSFINKYSSSELTRSISLANLKSTVVLDDAGHRHDSHTCQSCSDLKTLHTETSKMIRWKRPLGSSMLEDGYTKYKKARIDYSAAKLGLNMQSIEEKRSVLPQHSFLHTRTPSDLA